MKLYAVSCKGKSLGNSPHVIPTFTHPGVEGMPDGEEPLLEMAEDIKNLIFRARRLRNRAGPSMNPAVGKMLANTINILSAYAKVGALANTFRENGALDLLLTLLSSLYPDVRQSAGDMLRSLATFDLSSRAYVLLKLAKIDDRDPVHKSTTVQSRQMLLDLFSETASSSESEVLLKGITLPQVCKCSLLAVFHARGRHFNGLLSQKKGVELKLIDSITPPQTEMLYICNPVVYSNVSTKFIDKTFVCFICMPIVIE